jgi:hypothetical protein
MEGTQVLIVHITRIILGALPSIVGIRFIGDFVLDPLESYIKKRIRRKHAKKWEGRNDSC